jgi:hypothetical protein
MAPKDTNSDTGNWDLPKRGNEVLPVREKSGVLTAGKKIVC